jgi:sphinganine-1-phosphate aldolase
MADEVVKMAKLFALDKFHAVQRVSEFIVENFEKWQLILITMYLTYVVMSVLHYIDNLDNGLWHFLKKKLFAFSKRLPLVNSKIRREMEKTQASLENDLLKANKGTSFLTQLPPKGMSEKAVVQLADDYLKMNDSEWRNGGVSGCVYGADDSLTRLTTQIYERFAWTNPMHADVFPDVRKMEAEVVRMLCALFNGDENSCGTMSSGGTESIMLACKAYRDRAESRGIRKPEILCPITAHAAFDKAAQFFKMKIVHAPVDAKTKKVNVKKMKSLITENTCMLVGSAPNFPNGAIDPIDELSKLAVKYNLPLHVDACLGGLLIVFMEKAGYKVPLFDFRLPGVTSISCDTHKYGYTPKGSSVILYRNPGYRKFQYFSAVEWPGGIYVSPTFAGSRAGSLIAMTWATLVSIGHEGYVNITRDIIKTTRYIRDELKTIKEIELMCEPEVSVVAFVSKQFNILNLLDEMSSRGWHLNALQNPTGIHIAVTKLHTKSGVAERFVKDVRECVQAIMARDDRHLGKMAAIYCSTQGIPDKSIIADVAFLFLDACYNTKNKLLTNGAKNGEIKQNGSKHD